MSYSLKFDNGNFLSTIELENCRGIFMKLHRNIKHHQTACRRQEPSLVCPSVRPSVCHKIVSALYTFSLGKLSKYERQQGEDMFFCFFFSCFFFFIMKNSSS